MRSKHQQQDAGAGGPIQHLPQKCWLSKTARCKALEGNSRSQLRIHSTSHQLSTPPPSSPQWVVEETPSVTSASLPKPEQLMTQRKSLACRSPPAREKPEGLSQLVLIADRSSLREDKGQLWFLSNILGLAAVLPDSGFRGGTSTLDVGVSDSLVCFCRCGKTRTRSQGRNSGQELKQKPWKSASCELALNGLFDLLGNTQGEASKTCLKPEARSADMAHVLGWKVNMTSSLSETRWVKGATDRSSQRTREFRQQANSETHSTDPAVLEIPGHTYRKQLPRKCLRHPRIVSWAQEKVWWGMGVQRPRGHCFSNVWVQRPTKEPRN